MTVALEGGEWSAARPGRTLHPGKTRNPFYKRLGGPQGRSGRAEILVPTGIRSRTVQPVVSRYTDWATGHTRTHTHIYILYIYIYEWYFIPLILKLHIFRLYKARILFIYIAQQADHQLNTFRLLDTENRTVLPINVPIRITVTAADVLHSWTVPRLGVKTDATPGRLYQVRLSVKHQASYMDSAQRFVGQITDSCQS